MKNLTTESVIKKPNLIKQGNYLAEELRKDFPSFQFGVVTTEQAARYYTALKTRIVNQAVTTALSDINTFESLIPFQDVVNGIYEQVVHGIYDVVNFDQTISIDDFNKDTTWAKNVIWKVDQEKYLNYPIYLSSLINSFTSPARMKLFMNGLVKAARDTWNLHFFNVRIKTLLKSSEAIRSIVYDKTIATTNKDTKAVLNLIRSTLIKLMTPLLTHLKKEYTISSSPKVTKKLHYSSLGKSYTLILNNKFYQETRDLTATLFNKDDIAVNLKTETIDFSTISGVANPDKIKAILYEDKALRIITEAQKLQASTKVLKFKVINEELWVYTIMRDFTKLVYLFQDA